MRFGRQRVDQRPRYVSAQRQRARVNGLIARLKAVVDSGRTLIDESGSRPVAWLLPHRAELRAIALANGHGIHRLLPIIEDSDLRRLLVWRIARSTSSSCLFGLDDHIDDPSPAVRKQLAKTLRSAGAWAQLRCLADAWPQDEWVQRYAATDTPATPHSERLLRFVERHIDGPPAGHTPPMPLWASDRHWFLTPPKRDDYLRRMLLRIQRWVRGNATR